MVFSKIFVHISLPVQRCLALSFLQDECGDVPLHDAIAQDRVDVFEVLVNLALLDFTIVNKRGFNPLHHAVLKGKEM